MKEYKKTTEIKNKLSEMYKGKHFSPNTEFKLGHEVKNEWKEKVRKRCYKNGSGSYRQRAIEEKGRFCEICGIKEGFANLVVHHILHYDRQNSSLYNEEIHMTKNLMVLCKSCHAREHKASDNFGKWKSMTPEKQKELGWRK